NIYLFAIRLFSFFYSIKLHDNPPSNILSIVFLIIQTFQWFFLPLKSSDISSTEFGHVLKVIGHYFDPSFYIPSSLHQFVFFIIVVVLIVSTIVLHFSVFMLFIKDSKIPNDLLHITRTLYLEKPQINDQRKGIFSSFCFIITGMTVVLQTFIIEISPIASSIIQIIVFIGLGIYVILDQPYIMIFGNQVHTSSLFISAGGGITSLCMTGIKLISYIGHSNINAGFKLKGYFQVDWFHTIEEVSNEKMDIKSSI
ncbi:MAG: hypothetical protein EZS28_042288, partial [Streblomastix strix]